MRSPLAKRLQARNVLPGLIGFSPGLIPIADTFGAVLPFFFARVSLAVPLALSFPPFSHAARFIFMILAGVTGMMVPPRPAPCPAAPLLLPGPPDWFVGDPDADIEAEAGCTSGWAGGGIGGSTGEGVLSGIRMSPDPLPEATCEDTDVEMGLNCATNSGVEFAERVPRFLPPVVAPVPIDVDADEDCRFLAGRPPAVVVGFVGATVDAVSICTFPSASRSSPLVLIFRLLLPLVLRAGPGIVVPAPEVLPREV